MKKKIFLLLLTTLLVTGCWDHLELNNIAIVSGIALDKTKDDKILLTFLIPTSKAIKSSKESLSTLEEYSLIVSDKGDGILDAYNNIQKKLSRKIFLAQINGIIIGEDLAKEGISNILDFFLRFPNSNPKVNIFFTQEKASEIFNINSKQESNSIIVLNKKTNSTRSLNINFVDFLNILIKKGIEVTASQIIKIPLDENIEITSNTMCASINGSAVFSEDKINWPVK
jgi:spore germination protein KC